MLIKCPECGKEISDTSKKCIHCGFTLEAVQKPQPKQDNQSTEYDKELKKARIVGSYIEKLDTYLKWINRVLFVVAIAFFVIAISKLVNFVNYKDKAPQEAFKLLANTDKIRTSIHDLLTYSSVCLIATTVISNFDTLLYCGFVHKKIREEGFDYKKFYGNFPVDTNGEVLPPLFMSAGVLFNSVDVKLPEVIRYKTDLQSMLPKIIRGLASILLMFFALRFGYQVIVELFDLLMTSAVLGDIKEFSPTFDFTKILLFAGLFLLKIAVIDISLNNDLSTTQKWAQRIYKENHQTEENQSE